MRYAMRHVFRIFNLLISIYVSYKAFNFIYHELYSYLPELRTLESLNNATAIGIVLRENSMGLRELYNNAFEKSIIYSLIVFVISFIVLEYVRLGNILMDSFKKLYEKASEMK